LRQRLDRKKPAPFTNRSLYQIDHSKVIFERVARGHAAETFDGKTPFGEMSDIVDVLETWEAAEAALRQ